MWPSDWTRRAAGRSRLRPCPSRYRCPWTAITTRPPTSVTGGSRQLRSSKAPPHRFLGQPTGLVQAMAQSPDNPAPAKLPCDPLTRGRDGRGRQQNPAMGRMSVSPKRTLSGDGIMVDAPVLRRAERIASLAPHPGARRQPPTRGFALTASVLSTSRSNGETCRDWDLKEAVWLYPLRSRLRIL